MQQLMGLFQNSGQAFIEASITNGWIYCCVFSALSVFALMYYFLIGKSHVNGEKIQTTDKIKGYASLIGSVAFPLALIYNIYVLHILYTNPLLSVFEKVF